MTDKARLKLAALITALFLAAVSAAGVIAHSDHAPALISGPRVANTQRGGQSQPNPAPPSHEQEHD